MNIGDKVVCVDNSYGSSYGLKKGEIYTVRQLPYRSYYLNELVGSWDAGRFRSLEEMQNENFIRVAK
jgi:hypothetical protein